jgi:hypothetical protein
LLLLLVVVVTCPIMGAWGWGGWISLLSLGAIVPAGVLLGVLLFWDISKLV